MIESVVISFSVLLFLSYIKLGRTLSSPSFLYISGFLICSIVALNWKDEWGLDKMSPITAFILIGGAFTFFIVEYVIHKKCHHNVDVVISADNFQPIPSFKLILFFFFQIIVYYLMAKERMSYAGIGNLSESLSTVNQELKFEENVIKVPFYINHPYMLCILSRYIWCILFPFYLFKSKRYIKQKVWTFLNLAAGSLGTLLIGGRTGILNDIITTMAFYSIGYLYKTKFVGGLFNKKVMMYISIVGLAFILLFAQIGYAVGREEDEVTLSSNILFSVYCGAEIKNLDDYVQHPFRQKNEANLLGQYTFSGIFNKWSYMVNRDDVSKVVKYGPENSFNEYGEYLLGNVYTTYYAFLLDFGYLGAVIFTGLTSFLISIFYKKVLYSQFWKTGRVNLWLVFYSGVIPAACFLSFFSNKLYENLSITGTIRDMIYCWIVLLFIQGRKRKYETN